MVVGWSNLILYPTLALIRAQLGFKIQVQAKCGKNKQEPAYNAKLIRVESVGSERFRMIRVLTDLYGLIKVDTGCFWLVLVDSC